MQTKFILKIIGAALGLLALTAGVSFFYPAPASAPTGQESLESPQTLTVSISIDGVYTDKQVSIAAGSTVLQLLQKLNEEDPQLQLSTKEYSGLGTLVEGMRGMKNGDNNNYWQYKVNAIMPQIGADQYKLRDGDSVEWAFDVFES